MQAIHLDQKGRGRALRAAWSPSTASVVAYMDVDLATGLDALLPLVAPLLSGHSDVAIGTRLGPGAHVVRGARREIISRGYNLLLRSALRSTCTDAQCGFKAMRREAAAELLPLVEDDEWFFDTEVLVTAQRIGLRIHEVPVDWVDDTDSRVEVAPHRLEGPPRRVADARARVEQPAAPAGRPAPVRPDGRRPRDGVAGGPGRPVDSGVDRPSGRRRTAGPGGRRPGPAPRSSPTSCSGSPGSARSAPWPTRHCSPPSSPAWAATWPTPWPSCLCSLGNTAAHRGMAGTARHGLDRRHRLVTAAALLGVSLAFTTGALAATRAARPDARWSPSCAP